MTFCPDHPGMDPFKLSSSPRLELLPTINFFLGILHMRSEMFLVTDFALLKISFYFMDDFFWLSFSFTFWKLPTPWWLTLELLLLNLVDTSVDGVGCRVLLWWYVVFLVVLLVLLWLLDYLLFFFFSLSVSNSYLSFSNSTKSSWVKSRKEFRSLMGDFFLWVRWEFSRKKLFVWGIKLFFDFLSMFNFILIIIFLLYSFYFLFISLSLSDFCLFNLYKVVSFIIVIYN